MFDLPRLKEHKKIITILAMFIAFQFLPIYIQAKNYFSWLLLYEITFLYAVVSATTSLFNRGSAESLFPFLRVQLIIFFLVNFALFIGYQFFAAFFPQYQRFLAEGVGSMDYASLAAILPIFNLVGAFMTLITTAMIKKSRLRSSKAI